MTAGGPDLPGADPRLDRRRMARRNGMVAGGAALGVFAMLGLSFAAVPLYDAFCRITGFGGTTQVAAGTTGEVLDRTVAVRFTADADRGLPWAFSAVEREVRVRVGEPALVRYTATNTSDRPVAGQAVYNVNPAKTGVYFNKIQCFCFEEQILMPGESVEFPVYFFLDPAMDADRGLDDVGTVTLSYTFYPARSNALDEAIEDYYRSAEATTAATAARAAAGETAP